MGRCNMVMELFADHLHSFISLSYFTEVGRRVRVIHVAREKHLQFLLSNFDDKEALQAKVTRHFWNPIIKKGSKVEDERLTAPTSPAFHQRTHC